MTAVLINFELAKQIVLYRDESSTLSKILLPHLALCISYDFVPEDCNPIAFRFASALMQYYLDSKNVISKGFASFCLEFAPNCLQKLILNEDCKKSLSLALKDIGFNARC